MREYVLRFARFYVLPPVIVERSLVVNHDGVSGRKKPTQVVDADGYKGVMRTQKQTGA
jgi:hypothetical protein